MSFIPAQNGKMSQTKTWSLLDEPSILNVIEEARLFAQWNNIKRIWWTNAFRLLHKVSNIGYSRWRRNLWQAPSIRRPASSEGLFVIQIQMPAFLLQQQNKKTAPSRPLRLCGSIFSLSYNHQSAILNHQSQRVPYYTPINSACYHL